MKLEGSTVVPRGVAGACPTLARALSCDDLDAAAACFARDGCLITPDATAVHGRDNLRPVLAQMVARKTRVLVEASNAIQGGNVVLARERWRIRTGEPGGIPIEQTINAILVLHWVEETWKLAIAAPWGWGAGRF